MSQKSARTVANEMMERQYARDRKRLVGTGETTHFLALRVIARLIRKIRRLEKANATLNQWAPWNWKRTNVK